MLRSSAGIALVCLLAGCGNNLQSKEKVQAAIMQRLETHTGLNMNDLDVSTTSVRFDKNLAFATVAIHPKADSSVSKGMSMRYTLEARDGRWVVLDPVAHGGGTGAPGGHGVPDAPNGIDSLPPGHPQVEPPGQGSAPGRTP